MVSMQWKQLIGQERIKDVLGLAFSNETLGHAYLLCGEAGIGKFAAALELGMALLCKQGDEHPCYKCDSCQKVLKYAHPDFHVIMPVALEKEHRSDSKLSDEGWKYVSECVSKRISDPYALRTYSGVPSIPLEWVKEVNHAIVRGALEGTRNVAILDGIDYMSKEAANAMLKTLEEPPAGTLMLLLTDRVHAVLPTIISRCQILRFSYLSPEIISAELAKKYGLAADDQKIHDVAYTGSLGSSCYLLENPVESLSRDAAEFWGLCLKQDWTVLSEKIDSLSAIDDFGVYEKFFLEMMHLIRNAFFNRFSGTENYIMGNRSSDLELRDLNAPEKIEDLIEVCEDALKQISARANISLVLVNFAFSMMRMLNGKK